MNKQITLTNAERLVLLKMVNRESEKVSELSIKMLTIIYELQNKLSNKTNHNNNKG